MPVTVIKGNIFTSQSQTLVNTVNCVGVMGAGIALECRLRYPEMFERYVELCNKGHIDIGLLWLFKADDRWVLNFPTKKHWKDDSKTDYLRRGLEKFCETYKERGITSIAFPLLGADRGGLDPRVSENIMREYLGDLDIPVTIYQYDPTAHDDVYESIKAWLQEKGIERASKETGIRKNYMEKLQQGFDDPAIFQTNQLLRVKGIGLATVEKVFQAARNASTEQGSGETRDFF